MAVQLSIPVERTGTLYEAGSSTSMNSTTPSYLDAGSPDSIGSDALSIALIGPDEHRRREAATALLLCNGVEVREYSAYPASLDEVPRLLEMRNDVIIIDLDGNPEFALELVESICANGSATVMVFSSKADPDLLVRCIRAGAQESGQSTLLIDLDLPLGDAALNLGIVTEYSTVNALQDASRLDAAFLNKLLTKHSSGVFVLAAPGKFPNFTPTTEA